MPADEGTSARLPRGLSTSPDGTCEFLAWLLFFQCQVCSVSTNPLEAAQAGAAYGCGLPLLLRGDPAARLAVLVPGQRRLRHGERSRFQLLFRYCSRYSNATFIIWAAKFGLDQDIVRCFRHFVVYSTVF